MMKKASMIITLLCAMVQGAWAESVTFRVRSWDNVNKQVVTTQTTKDAIVLDGSHPDDWVGLTNGYYLVKSDTKYKVLNIMGDDVHLILTGGATLFCKHVKLEMPNKLHIHDVADNNTGTLDVTNSLINIQNFGKRHKRGTISNYKGIYLTAAAIGSGGEDANMGSLYVHGGTVSVLQSGMGAAIGGGKYASIGGEVVVYAGIVEAHVKSSEYSGAAIGGGSDYSQGGDVTIYGGKVKAFVNEGEELRNYGAGIGGGSYGGHGGKVTIWGGEVLAIGGKEAAGIGGGKRGAGGEVHIYGGTVEARGGEKCSAIGAYSDYKLGTVGFSDNMKVTGGTAARGSKDDELTPTIERVFTTGEREAACQWRKWVKVEACQHSTPTRGSDTTEPFYYTIDDNKFHTKHCRYCNTTWEEEHSSKSCVCGEASSYKFTVYVPDATKDKYKASTTTTVGAGKTFLLPACSVVPEGYTFAGWKMNPQDDDIKWAYVKAGDTSGDLIKPQASVTAVAGMDNAKFYARFLYIFNPTWEWADDCSWAKVTLKHKDLSDVTLSSTGDDPKVVITPTVLKETVTVLNDDEITTHEEEWEIGTRYTATCTYTKDGNEYTFSEYYDVIDVPAIGDMAIKDDADNSETITDNYDCPVNATLDGRTLYKDGSWNTLCLPFDVDDISTTPLAGATVKTLSSSSYDASTNTLTIKFSESTTSLTAGTPYIVKWTTTGTDVINPVFTDVTISEIEGGSTESSYINLVGSFSPVSFTTEDNNKLYLGTDNKLYSPTKARTMGSCRAYFLLHNGLNVNSLNANGARVLLDFGDGETTSIDVRSKREEVRSGAWYDLSGHKVTDASLSSRKGIYIHQGKKIVVK